MVNDQNHLEKQPRIGSFTQDRFLWLPPCLVYIVSMFTASFWVGHELSCSCNNTTGCHDEDCSWVCDSMQGRVGTPPSRMPSNPFVRAEPNSRQIRCLSPHCPGILHSSLTTRGVQDKVKGLRFSEQSPPPPPPPPTHSYPRTSPLPVTHLPSNLKPFIFSVMFFRQCNPESTLPCYSFV